MGFDLGKMTGGLFDSAPSLEKFSTLTPTQERVANWMAPRFQSLYARSNQKYRQPFVAGMSQYEQAGMGDLGKYMEGAGSYLPQRTAAYNRALSGQALAPIDPAAANAFFKNTVAPMYQQNFQKMANPALESAYKMGSGLSSSGMNRALAEQASGMGQQLSQMQYAKMLQDEAAQRERDVQNFNIQQQAAASASPEQQRMLQNIQLSQTAGALPRLLEQAQYDKQYQEWLRTRPDVLNVMQAANNFINTQMQGTYMQENPGLFSQLSGGFNQLTGLGGAMGGFGNLLGLGGVAAPAAATGAAAAAPATTAGLFGPVAAGSSAAGLAGLLGPLLALI